MKVFFLSFLFLLVVNQAKAQLDCHTYKGFAGDSTICYHQNGKISTIAWLSVEHKNYYHFLAFDINSNKVLEANHGYLHGSASLTVKYHPNGAIKSARKTFQPDGGIQHWDVTSFYNEDGTFHHEEDNSWDRILIHTEPNYVYQTEKDKTIKSVDSVNVVLKNTTSKKLKILVKDLDQKTESKIVSVGKNKEVEIGSFIPTSKKTEAQQFFSVEVLPRKKSVKTIIITNKELNSTTKQILLIISN